MVTKLPVTFVIYNLPATIEIMVTKRLLLQTLRNMPTVTKLPGYQLHLQYTTCLQLLK